jgi:hypothetical protein
LAVLIVSCAACGASSTPAAQSGGAAGHGPPGCFDATLLWFEDFETGDYSRWTGHTYNDDWGNDCQSTARTDAIAQSPTHSQRSEVKCPYTTEGNVHRGYGGVQFSGDKVLPEFTNTGVGLDAPDGVVNTHWVNIDTDTVFENGKWLSLWTSEYDCGWKGEVITLGIEDASGRAASAHHGTRTFESNPPPLPRRAWVRLTEYVNYYDGDLYVWQDGQLIEHATFQRPVKTICHFHWGLYASGDNDDVVLYEDDNALWKLNARWTDFTREPYFGHAVPVCNP